MEPSIWKSLKLFMWLPWNLLCRRWLPISLRWGIVLAFIITVCCTSCVSCILILKIHCLLQHLRNVCREIVYAYILQRITLKAIDSYLMVLDLPVWNKKILKLLSCWAVKPRLLLSMFYSLKENWVDLIYFFEASQTQVIQRYRSPCVVIKAEWKLEITVPNVQCKKLKETKNNLGLELR